MTTATDTFGDVTYFSQAAPAEMVRDDAGKLTVRGLPIFKAGEFKDSKGRQHRVTDEHLQIMESNFSTLKSNGVLPNVPVRLDHTQSVRDIVGYFDSVRVDGSTLLCDFTFTDPDAATKYENGTYRSRSCEVGPYETNGGELYHPVVQGFAFVDLPAVEGLFSRERGDDHKETPVTTPATEKPELATFTMRGVPTTDVAAVQAYITELEAAGEPKVHAFRLNTGEEADFAKVQAHIDGLENALTVMDLNARAEFVKGLAEGDEVKIAASQVEGLTELAKGMNQDQFAAFRKTYEDAPVLPTFARHGGTGGGEPGGPASDALDEKASLEAQVAAFRRGGMDAAAIAKTDAAQRLAAISK